MCTIFLRIFDEKENIGFGEQAGVSDRRFWWLISTKEYF